MQVNRSSAARPPSLDVNTLVTTLVNAKTAGQLQTLQTRQTNDNTQLSAIGQLKGRCPRCRPRSPASRTAPRSAACRDGERHGHRDDDQERQRRGGRFVFGQCHAARDRQQAVVGRRDVGGHDLGRLAEHHLRQQPGVQRQRGGRRVVSDIASSINSASGNAGVTASVITGSDGQHLVMQSNATGAANTISITGTGVNSKLTSGYDGHAGRRREADDRRHAGVERVEQRVGRADGRHAGAVAGRCRHDANRHAVAGHGRGDDRDQQFRDRDTNFVNTAKSLTSYDPTAKTAGRCSATR